MLRNLVSPAPHTRAIGSAWAAASRPRLGANAMDTTGAVWLWWLISILPDVVSQIRTAPSAEPVTSARLWGENAREWMTVGCFSWWMVFQVSVRQTDRFLSFGSSQSRSNQP